MIQVTCYGITEFWTSRKEAIAYYGKGFMASSGAEQDRYGNIVAQLMIGAMNVSDEGNAA